MEYADFLAPLGLPLARLLVVMSSGLIVAALLESLHWTRFMAKLAGPLVRVGHLRDIAGASFALAFFSPAAANALLAQGYTKGELSRRELIFANLFNSSPTFLVHLPTMFSLAFAFLGVHAFTYVGLTFFAAATRTALTVLAGRFLLPPLPEGCVGCHLDEHEPKGWAHVARRTLGRVKKRLLTLVMFTVPIYISVYAMQKAGWFGLAEAWMIKNLGGLSFLRPEAIGIIALSLVAESGAAFSAAASLTAAGSLSHSEVIMALLIGNIVSSPMRAFRHQFPAYAGYFPPRLALVLVVLNQGCRVCSLAGAAALYYWWMLILSG